ncbi:hypothetical protein HHI36_006193 [Cryptolaemus montrouzieri]|uniref:Activating molecule in BECN1-regulated autophagy protein 1 n=1 Tax=Cryptolaemus montrouzieri TaxID=559131 RepID=A0ABD2NWG4_9CUCU
MNPDELDFFRHLKKERNQNVAQNLIQSLDDRNLGHFKKNVKSKEDRELYAEEELIRKENYDELQCEMPGMPRSTFLMVFSPDGTKVASTHGNHNIYVTDLRSGKNVKTLVGHPRTPWCIAFHPSSNQIVASGCLGGQVRIWDLSGGSEVWTTTNQSVIASIAFHPNDRILVIATINEVYFWDWSKPEPFCHTATGNQKEKVRYVAFDKLGHKLITGISNSQNRWDYVRSSVPITRQSERSVSPYRRRITHRIFNITGRQNSQPAPVNNTSREPLSTVPERERNITMCYRNLVREYGRLVQRYLQLYRPPAMIDRGTDPMEQNSSSRNNSSTQVPELSTSNDPGPSRSDDIGASRSIEPESSRSNDSISSRSNDSGPSRSNDVNNHSSTQNQSTNTNHNPFQLLTPSRILSVMSRPTLIRSTQTTESRKHKTESNCQESSGGKKQKVNISSAEQASLHNTELTKTTSKTNQQAGPSHRSDSPQPGPSRIPEVISEERSDREQVLEDIIKGASAFKIRKDLFEKSESLISSKTGMNSSVASTHDRGDIGVSTLNSSNEARQNTSTTLPQGDSSTISSVSGAILKTNDSHTSPPTSRASSRITLMDFLNKLPKFSKATQKSKSDSGSSSTSEKSDNEQNVPERKSNGLNLTQNEESRVDKESSTQTENEVENLQENVAEGAPIDFSIPGTSRGDTEMTNSPREAQRLELMMMNIRRNAEDKLRSRFLPLIRSVPENVRLELIRVFEQGVKESREKARLRYRNMGQMFNKKQNRRPILDTSSDTTSSDDERDPLHIDFFNQAIENERKRIQGTSNVTGESSRAGPSQGRSESSTADAYHDINNLENWVTSLFDDIEPQGGSNSGTTNLTTAQTSTSVSTSTSISSLLDRPPRSNRVQSIRRIYAKVLRDRVNSRESTNPAPMSSTAAPIAPPNSSVNPVGNTSTRTTNSTIYSLARRRLGTHRASAFLPTRLYYPRTPPEFRRSRQFSFGRWRLNQRPYRSYNMSDILNTSNSGFAVDEVINFSELPNSEDDPIPANDRSSSNTSPNFPYHFHPFNPPPDLPTINPENIGIGNMYSNIVQDLETSLNDVRNIRAANRPGEMTDMLSNFSERLENIMNQSETILRNLRTSVEMLPGNDSSENGPSSSAPTASFNDANFYIRDQRAEAHDLERSIDSILDMNLDQERQSLTNRIDQMCTTMMLNSRYGGYSTHLTHSLRQLQTMIRQNSNQPSGNLSPRSQRRALAARSRALDSRSRALHRMNLFNRMRNSLPPLPSRAQEQSELNSIPEVVPQPSEDIDLHSRDAEITENRLRALRRMRCSLQSLCYRVDDRSNQNQETETRATDESTGQTAENLDLRARALEARTRAFHRMQMMDRMRNSLRSLPRFGEPPEQPHTQNSESDDNTRPTLSNQRRDQQVQGPSSEFGSWQETWNPPSTDRPNEEPRYGDSWTNNEQNTSSDRTFRITPSYRSPSTPNSTAPATSSNSEEWPSVSRWPWNVPSVQVNDVPVSEFGPSQESSESDNPPSLGINNNNNNSYPTRGVMARLAAIRAVNHPLGVFRPRFLHPLYASVNPFDADLDDPQREHIYDSDVITTVTPNHRIQVWDISDSVVPVISNPLKNVVVGECKIHNDASVDIASDGSILVTLLPSGGYLNVTNRLGVYSLKWETLGQCLYTTNFDHNAVSVSLSPLGRHLVVGLASRRVSIVPSERWVMARIFKIEQNDMPGDRLPLVRELDQTRDGRATSHKSVNCIRWLPTSGQGLIYATNTGQLVIWT